MKKQKENKFVYKKGKMFKEWEKNMEKLLQNDIIKNMLKNEKNT